MKFFIKDFFSKCDQIRTKLPIWSHLLKKSLIENFIFCAVLIKAEFPNESKPADVTSIFKKYRSSHRRCSVRKSVKHLCKSHFFNKVAGLRPATLLKKRPGHTCFPVNFVKFL